MPEKQDWQAWHEERERFVSRDSEGFTQDLKALEQHIKKLTEVSPKDKAERPVVQALNLISELTKDFNRYKNSLHLYHP